MRFFYNNEFDNYSLHTFLEHSSYPVENLQDYQLAKKWRSPVFVDKIDRGDCESATPPMIFDETVPLLSNATFARDITEAHGDTYSYKVTKTIAAGTAAYVYLVDSSAIDDMHGMVAGHTYTKSLWVKVPTASGIALNEVSIGIRDYDGSWEETESANPTSLDTWQKLTVTRTIRVGAVAANIRLLVESTAADTEYFYVDDIEMHDIPTIKIDAGVGLTITANSAAVLGHNLSSGVVCKIQGNATDEWNSPTVDETITYNADIMTEYFTSDSLRFWQLLIDDTDNPDGYVEMGRPILCVYLETPAGKDLSIGYGDTSSVDESLTGQRFGDERIIQKSYRFNFPYWTDTVRKSIVTMIEDIKLVKPILLVADENDQTKVIPVYCGLDDSLSIDHIIAYAWRGILNFKEVF